MDNKMIVLIVVVLLVIIGAVYVLANPSNSNQTVSTNNTSITNTTNNTNVIHNQTSHNSTKKNETPKVNITATQAQQIAIDSSADMGFPAKAHGTPILFKWTQNKLHTWVWDVPLEFEKGDVKYGSLYVDAYTGNIIMDE